MLSPDFSDDLALEVSTPGLNVLASAWPNFLPSSPAFLLPFPLGMRVQKIGQPCADPRHSAGHQTALPACQNSPKSTPLPRYLQCAAGLDPAKAAECFPPSPHGAAPSIPRCGRGFHGRCQRRARPQLQRHRLQHCPFPALGPDSPAREHPTSTAPGIPAHYDARGRASQGLLFAGFYSPAAHNPFSFLLSFGDW